MNKFAKVIIYFLSIAAFSCQPAHAGVKEDICAVNADIAMDVMKARQRGMTVTQTLSIFKGQEEEFKRFGEVITQWAYSKPRFDLPSNQNKAIADFGAEVYTSCVKVNK